MITISEKSLLWLLLNNGRCVQKSSAFYDNIDMKDTDYYGSYRMECTWAAEHSINNIFNDVPAVGR